eukprot:scaffold230722_cov22-Prasinocladus_malaysianus.AAC.2
MLNSAEGSSSSARYVVKPGPSTKIFTTLTFKCLPRDACLNHKHHGVASSFEYWYSSGSCIVRQWMYSRAEPVFIHGVSIQFADSNGIVI